MAATILVNENETFNDNLYEFESIGFLLAEIGRQLLRMNFNKNNDPFLFNKSSVFSYLLALGLLGLAVYSHDFSLTQIDSFDAEE